MKKLAPQWIVDDLEETIEFYTKKLEFSVDWKGNLSAIISRDNITFMFRQLKKEKLKRPNRIPFIDSGWHFEGAEAWDAYIWVDKFRGTLYLC
ncbi:hypothetical protein EYD45_12200 [Hyunsoonleella flava]|uniref:Glyoxalase/fosfomycin resistance/dioxygenase domain-containing protein n=1 Tax=Hyunsoonleella flava TaxID=2527939 RepID=A0A4Q9FC77_9FLAO|nr:VOC family protein [Hyunsoonleella flava]TBN02463.1 hypothetical protein EYD45_12200 [Hyunsoonleella flava]